MISIISVVAKVWKVIGGRGLIIVSAGVVTAIACSWSFTSDHSVRFNSYRTGRAFYRLPPLPIMYDVKTRKELSVQDINPENDNFSLYEDADKILPSDDIWKQASAAVEIGDLNKAKTLFEKYLEITSQRTLNEEESRQERRNSAYDILDALTALREGSSQTAVKGYLDGRIVFDAYTINAESIIPTSSVDKNLADNWIYLRAAILYLKQEKDESLKLFRSLVHKYPRSEKNQSARYMIAKLILEKSYVFDHDGCGIMGFSYGQPIDKDDVEPVEKCRDENWSAAIRAFKEILQMYPKGRYYYDSRGWLAYLYRRGGQRDLSLAEYYWLLGNPSDRNARLEAKKSLQIIGHEYDDETLDRVESLIASNADTAMAYAYHRIYNFAIDQTNQESCCSYDESDSTESEK